MNNLQSSHNNQGTYLPVYRTNREIKSIFTSTMKFDMKHSVFSSCYTFDSVIDYNLNGFQGPHSFIVEQLLLRIY